MPRQPLRLHTPEGPRVTSAAQLWAGIEDGTLSLDARVELDGGPPIPLRRALRALPRHEGPEHDALRLAVDGAPVGILVADLSGTIVYANPALCAMLGRPEGGLEGMFAHELCADGSTLPRWMDEALAQPEVGQRATFEKRLRAANGDAVPVLASVDLLRDPDGAPALLVGSATDLRRRVEVERAAAADQRLAAVSRVARGVAHDFNNLLTIIRASTELLREDLGPAGAGEAVEELDAIDRAALDAAEITSQLRALAREQTGAAERFDLGDRLSQAAALMRRLLPGGAEIELRLPEGRLCVEGDPGALDRALLGLTLGVELPAPAAIALTLEVRCDAQYAEVLVRQSGQLLISLDALRLPRVAPPAPADPRRLVGAHLLLVEDEPRLRTPLARALRQAGAHVVEAADGAEALGPLRDLRLPIDLVVSDVAMPQLDGWRVCREARAARPGVPVVLMSGFAGAEGPGGPDDRPDLFLRKPFGPGALIDALAGALQGRGSAAAP
jgi:PAS domain S-box-containing protein